MAQIQEIFAHRVRHNPESGPTVPKPVSRRDECNFSASFEHEPGWTPDRAIGWALIATTGLGAWALIAKVLL